MNATYSEAESRPAETAWTPEQLARFAASRAKTVAMAKARDKRSPVILANAISMVSFTRKTDGTVLVVTSILDHVSRKYSFTTVTMSLDAARAEYRKLLNLGYYRW